MLAQIALETRAARESVQVLLGMAPQLTARRESPGWSATAPVKLPFLCPKNSLAVQAGAEPAAGANLDHYLDGLERQRITGALAQRRGNKTGAARLLGITLRALRYRLEKLGMEA